MNAENIFDIHRAVLPGFVDVHTHLREPGFSYKETMMTGAAAATAGGYSVVCTMPNLDPVPDSPGTLAPQLKLIEEAEKAYGIRILPYGALTAGEKGEKLADIEALAEFVAAFSDDGRGVQSAEMMERAMIAAKAAGKIVAAHCEVNSLVRGGCVHDGEFAKRHGLPGICSESEWRQIERDLELAAKTGCAYHVCHVSAKESVALIREAKKSGVDVTCETAPHYLLLCDEDLEDDGRFKMNPPVRSSEDRDALIEGIKDGTVDMIATDHAPHSAEEKSKGLAGSLFGIVGLETAFPLLYTYLVLPGTVTFGRLMETMNGNPRRRFKIDVNRDHKYV